MKSIVLTLLLLSNMSLIAQVQDFLDAVTYTNLKKVKKLILKKGYIEAIDQNGNTALHLGAKMNFLLNQDSCGKACDLKWRKIDLRNSKQIMNLLIRSGIEIDKKNKSGKTALNVSSFNCAPATTKILLDNGASLNSIDNYGKSPVLSVLEGFTNYWTNSKEFASKREKNCFKVLRYIVQKKPKIEHNNYRLRSILDLLQTRKGVKILKRIKNILGQIR